MKNYCYAVSGDCGDYVHVDYQLEQYTVEEYIDFVKSSLSSNIELIVRTDSDSLLLIYIQNNRFLSSEEYALSDFKKC